MFTGHFGIAMGGKGVRPRVPMVLCVGAAFAPDLVRYGLLLAGVPEAVALGMGSVLVGLVLAGAVGWGGAAYTGHRADGYGLAGLVLLHLATDAVTNRLMLWPGGPEMGLRLYFYPAWDFALEATVVLLGWGLYRRTLPPERRNHVLVWLVPPLLWAFQYAFWQMN